MKARLKKTKAAKAFCCSDTLTPYHLFAGALYDSNGDSYVGSYSTLQGAIDDSGEHGEWSCVYGADRDGRLVLLAEG